MNESKRNYSYTNSSIDYLIDAYVNEKNCSRLLPYKSSVDTFWFYLEDRLYEMETDSVIKSLLEMEYNRINYFLKEYLLVRIDKIRHLAYIDRNNLSSNETIFYESYYDLIDKMSINYNQNEGESENEFVGFICLTNIDNIKIDDNVFNLRAGEFYITSLSQIYKELIDEKVKLV
ncbi:hypothetical protein A0H76_24 [Hepatospora eriocheir]|uniref:DNA replication complex GINS protein SLD5 n=1 Tax=Hepatospora eriocheir TaxID=1081669 RepID=A0A1X0QEP1_9MICR|nr:hypothetical protein A0H76_24 [Hepatospora eriocheir]